MRLALTCLALALVMAGGPSPALAGCADPAAPGVDWFKCGLEEYRLAGSDLTGARLREARLGRADFTGADLSGADARRARLGFVKAEGARLVRTDLRNADLTYARLADADLTEADLRTARLFRANLRGAILTGARLDGADLLEADFTNATWTDGQTICGPGSLGICRLPKAQPPATE